jgi:hypothetical protein
MKIAWRYEALSSRNTPSRGKQFPSQPCV